MKRPTPPLIALLVACLLAFLAAPVRAGGIDTPPPQQLAPSSSPTFTGGHYTGNLSVDGTLGVGASVTSINGSVATLSGAYPFETHSTFANSQNLYTHADAQFRAPYINFYKSKGTQAAPTALTETGYELDSIGGVNFGGWDGTLYYNGAASILTQVDENWDATHHGAHLSIYGAAPGSATVAQIMQFGGYDPTGLNTPGNLGIATNIISYRPLAFNGNRSTNPALIPASSPATIKVRAADDSADAALTVGNLTASGNTGLGSATALTAVSLLNMKGVIPTATIGDNQNKSWTVGDLFGAVDFSSDDLSSGGTANKVRARIAGVELDTFGASQGLAFYTTRIANGTLTKQLQLTDNGDLISSLALVTVPYGPSGGTGARYFTIEGSGGSGTGNVQLATNLTTNVDGQAIGNLEWHNSGATGTNTRSAYIRANLSGTGSSANIGSKLTFGTEADGANGTGTDQWQMDSSGVLSGLTTTSAVLAPRVAATGANGQLTTQQQNSAQTGALSGATVTLSNLIPAGSDVIGVTCRVTTAITGATSFDVGDGTTADRFCNDVPVSLNTTCNLATNAGTGTSDKFYAAATNVVLTANGSNFTAGVVRCTAHYISLTAATS